MKLSEKIGYGFGDMSSSMFWKLFSYFLPFFYSNVFGLSLADAGVLMLVTRIWDAVSDPMMGIIADRTKTRWGKYRPYLLYFALPFAVCGILLFTCSFVRRKLTIKNTKQQEAITIIAFCQASGLVEMAASPPVAFSATTRALSNILQRGSHAKRAMKLPP